MAYNAGVGGTAPNPYSYSGPPKDPSYHGPPMEWGGDGYRPQPAPPGYTWDSVEGKWVHSPTQQGQAVNEYNTAASPALAGLLSSVGSSATSGAASAFGGGVPNSASASGSAAGGVGGGAPGGGGVSGGNYVAPIQMPSFKGANDAAFATAKDKVGGTGRASLDALRGELGASGMLGGGAEGQLTKDVIQGASGELGQVARDQAVSGANMAADFAKTGYSGSIAQRGQDVSAQEAQARLAQEKELSNARMAFEQRQADSQKQLQLLTLALSGLKGSSGGSGLVY